MPFRSLLTALVAALVFAPAAQAAWFPAEAVDGPSPDILAFGDIDMARDGTGGLVYVKAENGIPHVFLSRHYLGVWRSPERVDVGNESAASQPVIAAGDDHRLAIVWVSGGKLHGTVAPGGPPQPLPAPQLLYADTDPLQAVTDPHIDLGINGTAYATFTAPGPGGSDVRAVRLQGTAWEPVAAPLDVGLEQAAGVGAGRSRVAVSAEGNAVAVWGEAHSDGRSRVYGRRLYGLQVSVAPQEISLPDFEGALGGNADSPDLDIEDDGSYAWVAFRQDFNGTSRAISRRLVGSLFEAPVAIDGGGPADAPRIAMSGRGVGISAVGTASRAVQVALLERDAFGQSYRVDTTGSAEAPQPVATTSEREASAMVWRSSAGPATGEVRARFRPDAKAFDPEQVISTPDFGPVPPDALEITEDRLDDFAVGFLQGAPGSYRVVVASWDRPPGTPMGLSSAKPRKTRRATLKWRPGSDLWGAQRFRVIIDGVPAGETDRSFLQLKDPLIDGAHTWGVVAIDRRGQETPMRTRTLRVDGLPPLLKVTIDGKRKAGMAIKVSATASDGSGGYGLSYVEIDWGDASPRFRGLRSQHRYRRGKFSLAVKAVDKARNVTRRVYTLRIKK
jgi:hypothetical protein